MSAQYYTVVYCIDGGNKTHDRWWREVVMPYWCKSEGSPIRATATACYDAIERCDELEKELNQGSFW